MKWGCTENKVLKRERKKKPITLPKISTSIYQYWNHFFPLAGARPASPLSGWPQVQPPAEEADPDACGCVASAVGCLGPGAGRQERCLRQDPLRQGQAVRVPSQPRCPARSPAGLVGAGWLPRGLLARPHGFASGTAGESRPGCVGAGGGCCGAAGVLRCCQGAAQQVELSARRSPALLQSHFWTRTPGGTALQRVGGRGTAVRGGCCCPASGWHWGLLQQRRGCVYASHEANIVQRLRIKAFYRDRNETKSQAMMFCVLVPVRFPGLVCPHTDGCRALWDLRYVNRSRAKHSVLFLLSKSLQKYLQITLKSKVVFFIIAFSNSLIPFLSKE